MPPNNIRLLLIIDLAICAAFILNFALGGPFLRFFDLDGEGNLPSWYSSSKLLLIAILLAALTYSTFSWESKSSWILAFLAAAFLFLSADKGAQIHEWINFQSDALLPDGTRVGTPFAKSGIWMFTVGLPAAAVIFGALYRFRAQLRQTPRVFMLYILGFAVFFAGAVGVEMLATMARDAGPGWYTVQVTAEEFMEMTGATLLLWAAVELARGYGFHTASRVDEQNSDAPRRSGQTAS